MNFDVLIIGGGTAGEYATGTALQHSKSVCLVEKTVVGGDCIFHACIPTKAMVHAARAYKRMKAAGFFGLPSFDGEVDYKKVKAYKDKIVSSIGSGRDERWIKAGVTVIQGNAKFISPSEVQVGSDVIKAKKIVICTGSAPAVPPIPGLKEAGYITNVEALELEKPPRRLGIIGGGPIGVEFAQIFSTFGTRVHIYEALDNILANEDADVSQVVAGLFAKQGISVTTSVMVSKVEKTSSGRVIYFKGAGGVEQKAEYDELFLATGRRPNIADLNLEAAGIAYTRRGITVDDTLKTNIPNIWAAGDVNGKLAFTYVAGEQGKTAAINATQDKQLALNYDVLPRATFCDPEVASVGLTAKQALEAGHRIKTGSFDYANLTRPIVSDEMDGFIKVVVDEDSGRILGGHIVGAEASTLIHEVAVAMAGKLTAADVGNTLHSYPTLSEGVRYACQAAM